jgi:hypothetical protein
VERFNSKGNEMAESKFTPGPWRVSNSFEGGNQELWVYADMTYLGSVANSSMTPEEILANAELWADAPKMLEVLRSLHDFALPLRHIGLPEAPAQALADAKALLEKHGG